ncbi:hypothetical protein DFH09DRAFT_1119573 [Mycena vulgaris]|nr:hypothetical protein DFH09DRAFT_1119573 [Mycena vulgaris]
MADTMEPIVIPPLKVERHFTCSGSGLRYEDQERVSADSLRTLLLPNGGRNGISDRDRSKAWWGAQALFYGLKYTKTMNIAQVRAQLEDALRDKNKGLRVPQDILDLEYKYNKEFRELNAQVRDKAGMGAKRKREADPVVPKASKSKSVDRATNAKTKAEPTPDVVPAKKPPYQADRRCLYPNGRGETPHKANGQEDHSDGGRPDGPFILDGCGSTHKADSQKDGPTCTVGSSLLDGRGCKTGSACSTHQDHRRRTAPISAAAVASSSSMPDPPARTKQTARRGRPFPAPPARSSAPRADSVSGAWEIDCPAISGQWEHMGDFTLNIVGRGGTLEGEFELGIISGLLRCDRVEQRGANGAYAAVHWAGQENEGPVCTPNPRQTGYIKFTGDKLKGKLNSVPACGDVEFEGQWVGGAGRIMAGWDDYDEEAYERANRNRWH